MHGKSAKASKESQVEVMWTVGWPPKATKNPITLLKSARHCSNFPGTAAISSMLHPTEQSAGEDGPTQMLCRSEDTHGPSKFSLLCGGVYPEVGTSSCPCHQQKISAQKPAWRELLACHRGEGHHKSYQKLYFRLLNRQLRVLRAHESEKKTANKLISAPVGSDSESDRFQQHRDPSCFSHI